MDFKLLKQRESKQQSVAESPDVSHHEFPLLQLQRVIGHQSFMRLFRQEEPNMSAASPEVEAKPPSYLHWLETEEDADLPFQPFTTSELQTFNFSKLVGFRDELNELIFQTEDEKVIAKLLGQLLLTNQSLEVKASAVFAQFNPDVVPILMEMRPFIKDKKGAATQEREKDNRDGYGLPTTSNEQIKFIDVMSLYLGSAEGVASHFAAMRQPNVPGSFFVHEPVAKALENVQQLVNGKMPTSYVGLGIRGRFHSRESKSRMAHPLGLAIDYYPLDNSMVTDDHTIALLETITDQSSHMNLEDAQGKPLTYNNRRRMISTMANGAQQEFGMTLPFDHYVSNFDAEFTRVAQASLAFRNSLNEKIGEDSEVRIIDRLREMRMQYLTLRTQKNSYDKFIKKAEGAKSKATPEEVEQAQGEISRIIEEIDRLRVELGELLSPWFKIIDGRLTELEKDASPLDERLAQISGEMTGISNEVVVIDQEIEKLDIQLQNKSLNKKDRGELRQQRQTLKQRKDTLTGKNSQQKKLDTEKSKIEKSDVLTERQTLQQLKEKLVDLDYFMGTNAVTDGGKVTRLDDIPRDAPIMQILNRGWFTPEGAEYDPVIQMSDGSIQQKEERRKTVDDKRTGFNAEFMKAMMQSGFDLGIAWDSLDAMHFELVSAVDSVPEKSDTASGFEIIKQRYNPPKRKRPQPKK